MAGTFWQHIKSWDQWLFKKINGGWSNGLFDGLMPFMRESLNWAPLYIFLLVFMPLNFKKQGWWWVLLFLTTIALTDMTGNYAFKHSFERLRPCNDPDFYMQVRLLADRCGSGYSFTSNHAANHFGMATFFLLTFRRLIGKWAWLGIAWAACIAYAQVYVGVHYPLDVFGGAILGIAAGALTGILFATRFSLHTS